MRVLVTGANGLIGVALCAALKDSADVVAAVRKPVREDEVAYDATRPVALVNS